MTNIKITKMQKGAGMIFVIMDYSEYEKTGLSMSELAVKSVTDILGSGLME